MDSIAGDRDAVLNSAWRQAQSIAERLGQLRQQCDTNPEWLDLPKTGPSFDQVIADIKRTLDGVSISLNGMPLVRRFDRDDLDEDGQPPAPPNPR